jgi:hypothetical protein
VILALLLFGGAPMADILETPEAHETQVHPAGSEETPTAVALSREWHNHP